MLYTSYFAKAKFIEEVYPEIALVSIAGKTPLWFKGHKFSALAPKYDWWKKWHDQKLSSSWYRDMYYSTVLNKLNAKNVECGIYALTSKKDACIMCYETPEKFCHRHILAEWLNKNGILCKELNTDTTGLKLVESALSMQKDEKYLLNGQYICKLAENAAEFSSWKRLSSAKAVLTSSNKIVLHSIQPRSQKQMHGEIVLFDNQDLANSYLRYNVVLKIGSLSATLEVKSIEKLDSQTSLSAQN